MLFPPVHPTPGRETPLHSGHGRHQRRQPPKRTGEVECVLLHGLGSLSQTAVRRDPTTDGNSQCCTTMASSLAYTSHRMRHGFRLRDSSTRP